MRWDLGDPAPDPALTDSLTQFLSGWRGPLRAYGSVPSTQALARTWAEAGAPDGAVVVADHQTAGRGRRGRTWTAPPGHALLFSLVLRPSLAPLRWPQISLAAGCAVGEGIERVSAVAPQLKWPNDVLLEGRKVAGILAEGVVGPRPFVVLGVGVNVSQPAEAWSADLRGRAVAVASVAPGVTRGPLLAAILERIAHWHAVLGTDGFEPVRTAWRVRARLGDRVRVGADEATAMDLSPEGGLLVRRPDGSTAVIFADVDERPGREPVAAGGMDRA